MCPIFAGPVKFVILQSSDAGFASNKGKTFQEILINKCFVGKGNG